MGTINEATIVERYIKMKTLLNAEYDMDLYVRHGMIYINTNEENVEMIPSPSLDVVQGFIAAMKLMENQDDQQ